MEKIFEGSISCKALLENQERECIGLYINKKKKTKDFQYIRYLAHTRNIPIYEVERETIDSMSQGKTHGGILLKAMVKEKHFLTKDTPLSGYCAYIDGLEDPYNLGSVLRTLYASGCKTLLLPERDWSMSEQIILKASAGAYEKLPILWIQDDDTLIESLQAQNMPLILANRKDSMPLDTYIFPSAGAYEKLPILWIQDDDTLIESLQAQNMPLILANRKDSMPLDTYIFPKDFCIGIGGALRGIRAKTQNAASQNLHIQYGRDFKNALDTASAVAVFAFTICAQQQRTGEELL